MLQERTARIVRMTSYDLIHSVRAEAADWSDVFAQATEAELIDFVSASPLQLGIARSEFKNFRALQSIAAREWNRRFRGAQ